MKRFSALALSAVSIAGLVARAAAGSEYTIHVVGEGNTAYRGVYEALRADGSRFQVDIHGMTPGEHTVTASCLRVSLHPRRPGQVLRAEILRGTVRVAQSMTRGAPGSLSMTAEDGGRHCQDLAIRNGGGDGGGSNFARRRWH